MGLFHGIKPRDKWVLEYLLARSLGRDVHGNFCGVHIETTPTFDDGMEFVVAFNEAFPGRVSDPNLTLGSARLARVCRRMVRDGWLERWRLGNEVDLPGTPRWQWVYRIPQAVLNDLKNQRITLVEEAR
jgi:hypothetical protein